MYRNNPVGFQNGVGKMVNVEGHDGISAGVHASSNHMAIIRIRQHNRGNDGLETLNRRGRKRSIHKVSSSLELRTRQVWPSGEIIDYPLFVNQV